MKRIPSSENCKIEWQRYEYPKEWEPTATILTSCKGKQRDTKSTQNSSAAVKNQALVDAVHLLLLVSRDTASPSVIKIKEK